MQIYKLELTKALTLYNSHTDKPTKINKWIKKKRNWVLRNVQIRRGSFIAANPGAKRSNDPNHCEN